MESGQSGVADEAPAAPRSSLLERDPGSFLVERVTSLHQERVKIACEVFEAAKAKFAAKKKTSFNVTVAHPLRHLWSRPQRRRALDSHKDQDHGELHEHWIELFNDLIMVAMLSNMSHLYEVGGRTATNHISMVVLWIIMMQSLHYVSWVINLWNVDDLFQLLICFTTTLGTVLMAAGVKSDVHPPCTSTWLENPQHVQRFNCGALISQVSQLVFGIQAAIFDPMSRGHVAVMLVGNSFNIVAIMFVTGWMKYVLMAATSVLGYIICWKFTNLVALLDLEHLRGRADLMVLVSLGEWVITTIIREMRMESLVAQTSLDLMLAAEYFNTRQHGSSLGASTREPMDLLYLESVEYGLQYAIAICLFFLPASVSVAMDLSQFSDHDGSPRGNQHGPHARAMSARAGQECNLHSGWDTTALRWHSASVLCTTRVLLIGLRHVRKSKVQAQLPPGKKFYVRLGLCLLHLLVPMVGEEHHFLMFGVHTAIVFVDLMAELSIYKLGVQTARRWHASIVSRASRSVARPADIELT